METTRTDLSKWACCGECGHKLFRALTTGSAGANCLEIKCSSCSAINVIRITGDIPEKPIVTASGKRAIKN